MSVTIRAVSKRSLERVNITDSIKGKEQGEMLVLKFAELRRQVRSPIDIVIEVKEAVFSALRLLFFGKFRQLLLGPPSCRQRIQQLGEIFLDLASQNSRLGDEYLPGLVH